MKKVGYSILLALLVVGLVLPCSATLFNDNIEDYEEYEEQWSDKGTAIHYERLSFLGDFVYYHPSGLAEYNNGFTWIYRLNAGRGVLLDLTYLIDIDVYFRHSDVKQITLDAVVDAKNMRTLKYTEDDELLYSADYLLIITENIRYYYRAGNLQYICCEDSRNPSGYYCFSVAAGAGLGSYPYHKRDVISRLLDYNTAPEALTEFESRIEGTYVEPPSVLQVAISGRELFVGAISGAVLAGVGAWLITFLIMRKKRGAPAPAMAGAPTGEVLAGSDGNVCTAPAAPESPAPPESSTPPKAAGTDDPSKNE